MGMLMPQTHCRLFGRRSFMREMGCAALSAAIAPALGVAAAGIANAANWRGFVGCIKPRANDSSLVEMIRLLPRGIGVAPVYLNFSEGTREELQNSYGNYEQNVAYLASQHCDVISIEGAPPFMILGPDGEARLVDSWKEKYKTDMFTSSQNQVNVLRAMKIRKIIGITSFGADLNKSYAKYFEDCGISVIAMEGIRGLISRHSRGPCGANLLLYQKDIPCSWRSGRHLHFGVGARRARYRRNARTGPWRAGRSADRGAHMGNPASPPRPSADQRLWRASGNLASSLSLDRIDIQGRQKHSSVSGRRYPTFASPSLLSSFRGNLILIGRYCLHLVRRMFLAFFSVSFDDVRLFCGLRGFRYQSNLLCEATQNLAMRAIPATMKAAPSRRQPLRAWISMPNQPNLSITSDIRTLAVMVRPA